MDLTATRTETRWLTKTDTTTFQDADLDREANIVYARLVMEMLQAAGHLNEQGAQAYTDFKAETGLVAGDNGFNGEYALPSDCLVPTRIEVKYTDNLAPVTVYDASQNTRSEFGNFSDSFSSADPKIRFFRNSILVRPLPETTVTNGLYIEYLKRQAGLSGTSDVAVFEANFHDLIPLGTAMRFFLANPDKFNLLVKNEYEEKMEEFRTWYRDRFKQVMQIVPIREKF